MDREWMRRQLEAFEELALRYERSKAPGAYIGDEALYAQLHRAEPTVKQILRVEGRTWRGFHHHVTCVAVAHAFLTWLRLGKETAAA